MVTVKAAALVLDQNLYPRHQINDQHVRELQYAAEAGIVLPPVIADKKSKRVVDGYHRVTRALRYDGDGATVPVEWRAYPNEQEVLLDAIRLNAAHGQKYSSYDVARAITLAEELKIEPAVVASALNVTVDRVMYLAVVKRAIGPGAKMIPIKRTVAHLAGQKLSRNQVEGNRRAVGHHQLFLVNQVINLIEHDLLDTENETLVERLVLLAKLLRRYGIKKTA